MELRFETVEPKRVAAIRHIGPYEEIGEVFPKLMAWAGPRRLLGPDTTILGIYYDCPKTTPPEELRSDAAITVGEDFEPEGEVNVQQVDGGEYAAVTHVGPYEKLGETWKKLMDELLPASGRKVRCAPCIEIYRNDPQRTPPEELATDIYVPIEPEE